MKRPLIVCLCGSTKFEESYADANRAETLQGKIVLSVGVFGHQESEPMTSELKSRLDELHLRKIDLADEILVLNIGGYIGTSTQAEINYAISQKKPIHYWEN